MKKALRKMPGFSEYDKDGVQLFDSTHHLIDVACKNASKLASKQANNPCEDPFTSMHLLIDRFMTLKREQNFFW